MVVEMVSYIISSATLTHTRIEKNPSLSKRINDMLFRSSSHHYQSHAFRSAWHLCERLRPLFSSLSITRVHTLWIKIDHTQCHLSALCGPKACNSAHTYTQFWLFFKPVWRTKIIKTLNPWHYSSKEPSAYPSTLISVFLTGFCYFSYQVATQLSSRG